MARISGLITEYNSVDKAMIATSLTTDIATWITSMVNTFGLNGEAAPGSTMIGWSGIEVPDYAKPYVSAISQTRDALRNKARSSKGINAQDVQEMELKIPKIEDDDNTSSGIYQETLNYFRNKMSELQGSENLPKEVLSLCDRVRDVYLWNTGVYLEDRDGEPALIRPLTRELRAARVEKEDRERQKRTAKEQREKQAAAKADKGRLSHLDMFRTNEYSAWNEEGLPTKDQQGGEITKSREKKLKKDWAAQKKLHKAWIKANEVPNGTSQDTNES